ncbi:MAG: cysteine desulfurase family protein [Mycobacteriales bacterium]
MPTALFYLYHASTTPMRPAPVAAVTAELGRAGNPSSTHAAGRAARRIVEEAREAVAAAYAVDPVEVLFTAGGTEADNLGVLGGYRARATADPRRTRIVTTAIEHHAVLDAVRALAEHDGAEVVILAVGPGGVVDPDDLLRILAADADRTALVAVMWANNETGAVQPIPQLAEIAREHGVPLHTDAVQAAAQLHIDLSVVDTAALTAHKLGGPVGIGALIARRDAALAPVGYGGGQERGLRSGTLDAAAAAGFAAAVAEMRQGYAVESSRVADLRDRLVAGVQRAVPEAVLTAAGSPRLPNIANIRFPGAGSDEVLLLLDAAGICAAAGSACTAGVSRPSHVLQAMAVDPEGAIRFSLGHTSTAADVDAAVAAIGPAVDRGRAARLAGAAR